MAISIRSALKNVASENYNKANIFVYFVLLFIASLCGIFFPQTAEELTSPNSIFAILIYLILIFPITGITITATNNAIRNVKGIFPDITKNFTSILLTGIQYFIGATVSASVMFIICAVIMTCLMAFNPLAGLLILPIALFFGFLYFGLYFNYIISLKFSDWFKIKKGLDFLNKSKKRLGTYILKTILLQILFGVPAIIIVITGSFIIGFMGAVSGPGSAAGTKMAASSFASIVYTILFGISGIYMIDLTRQFIREILPPKKKAPAPIKK